MLIAAGTVLIYYFYTGVPPVPARASEVRAALGFLSSCDLDDDATIYDLGCGWGSLMAHLARAFPKAKIVGIEISPLAYLVAMVRAKRMPNARVVRGDFHNQPLETADAVICYLMMAPMTPLAETLDNKLRSGTPVVALSFWFRGRRATGTRDNVALYRWPAKK